MNRLLRLACVAPLALVLGGCPQPGGNGVGTGPVTARITISAMHGPAPLLVVVNGDGSTSTAGNITGFAWDFAGLASATTDNAQYTFQNPGRYLVRLTATDSAGNHGVDGVEVRAAGSGAVTAVIQSNVDSGGAPLGVQFDGTSSSATDDTIYDYAWDFGDNTTSVASKPFHVFSLAGTYTVTLKVTTGGGVDATTSKQILVGASNGASLQFSGNQYVTLLLETEYTLTAWTFSAWVRPETAGGELASLGGGSVVIDVNPATNRVHVLKDANDVSVAVGTIAGAWHFLSVVYDGTTTSVYIDAQRMGGSAIDAGVTLSSLIVGQGFNGRITRVGLWSLARTATQLAGDMDSGAAFGDAGLLGYWALDEGASQNLKNVMPSRPGYLGSSSNSEAVDPAWSQDAPVR